MPDVRDPSVSMMPIHAMRTRLVARDPYGVVHLIWGVGNYNGDKKKWVAPCYAVEVKPGTWERSCYEILDSTILGENDIITCLGCIAIDNGL